MVFGSNWTQVGPKFLSKRLVVSGLPTRTKPQAPRSLQQWLASSFEAGIVCESQEVPHCDTPTQDDARGTRASQLLTGDDAALSALRRAVRPTLRQVTRQARSRSYSDRKSTRLNSSHLVIS